jgi:hypothetical protein
MGVGKPAPAGWSLPELGLKGADPMDTYSVSEESDCGGSSVARHAAGFRDRDPLRNVVIWRDNLRRGWMRRVRLSVPIAVLTAPLPASTRKG